MTNMAGRGALPLSSQRGMFSRWVEQTVKAEPHTGIRMLCTRDSTGGTVIRLFRILALSLAAALAGAGPVFAVDYPVRPVKWIVPYPPGGTTDVLARIIAQWLTEKMGQAFVV